MTPVEDKDAFKPSKTNRVDDWGPLVKNAKRWS
jgi:hypothetical protein